MKSGYFKDSSRCFTAYLHIFGRKDGMYSNIFVAALVGYTSSLFKHGY